MLAQESPPGGFEVVIAVSDAADRADLAAAAALAGLDPRVRTVTAARPGPAAARNAGMAAARGNRIALLDDDCVAQPGWLAAGSARLDEVDLVQGRVWPLEPTTTRYDRTIHVVELTWLWESCNLFVRRAALERTGGFDETWNPTGRAGRHWGEDADWGWRLLGDGATYAFEAAAEVRHEVFHPGFGDWLRYEAQVRWFPLLVREHPGVRRRFPHGVFLTERHVTLTAAAGLLAGAGVARALGRRRTAALTAAVAAVPLLSPLRFAAGEAPHQVLREAVHFGALVYGSARYRRILL